MNIAGIAVKATPFSWIKLLKKVGRRVTLNRRNRRQPRAESLEPRRLLTTDLLAAPWETIPQEDIPAQIGELHPEGEDLGGSDPGGSDPGGSDPGGSD
ncbi:MAG: hypothetical protein AAF394_16430, partial [Planctomycetota bacterium]